MSGKLALPESRTCAACGVEFETLWRVRKCNECRASAKGFPKCTLCGARCSHNRGVLCTRCRAARTPILRPMSATEIAWVAGLLEGEATFQSSRGRKMIHVTMTDRDVLDMLALVTGVGSIYTLRKRERCKQAYKWVIGWQSTSASLVTAIYPWLSARRRVQAAGLLEPDFKFTSSDHSSSSAESWAWAAGILEGEGSFLWRTGYRVEVTTTDQDVANRLRDIAGSGSITTIAPRKPNWSQCYVWRISRKQNILDVCAAVHPFMGRRRRTAIESMPVFQAAPSKHAGPPEGRSRRSGGT